MIQEITAEYAKKAQKDAEWAYNNAMEKFYYSMLEVIFLRIKSHLSLQGLKKVIEMDAKRKHNENLRVEFSQKTWAILAESWAGTEGLAIIKIADLYGLEIADLDISKIERLTQKPDTPRCEPTNTWEEKEYN
tara:strand:+ start:270 stop:668 length:399 start_codon:yes stop_codon:yes gene_type:complete